MKIAPSNIQPFNRKLVKLTKTTGAGEQKTVPPGRERVQARLQSGAAADRNAGQATATDRISRNIARYAETQAIAPPPTTDPVTPSITVDSTAATPVDTTASTSTAVVADTAEAAATGGESLTV